MNFMYLYHQVNIDVGNKFADIFNVIKNHVKRKLTSIKLISLFVQYILRQRFFFRMKFYLVKEPEEWQFLKIRDDYFGYFGEVNDNIINCHRKY